MNVTLTNLGIELVFQAQATNHIGEPEGDHCRSKGHEREHEHVLYHRFSRGLESVTNDLTQLRCGDDTITKNANTAGATR